jgi:hypothetical protein
MPAHDFDSTPLGVGAECTHRPDGRRVSVLYLESRTEGCDDRYFVQRAGPHDVFTAPERDLVPLPKDNLQSALDDMRLAGPVAIRNNARLLA